MSFALKLLLSTVIAFLLNLLAMKFLPLSDKIIGHDRGKIWVEGSEVNINKPTGVGFYFVIIFAVVSGIFVYNQIGLIYILILTLAAMVTGVLDDRSKEAWGEYIKGALDAIIAFFGALCFVYFFGREVTIGLTGYTFEIPVAVYVILAFILYIVAINATNATDGIDGLSATLTIITVASAMAVSKINGTLTENAILMGAVLIAVLLAYLIFNFNPSKVLMGDAGSRAIGFFIAFYLMYLKIPFAYLIICLIFLLDGGLSVLKITIGRLTRRKIIILKNTITPIHDHLRKRKGLSIKQDWAVLVCADLLINLIYIACCYFI